MTTIATTKLVKVTLILQICGLVLEWLCAPKEGRAVEHWWIASIRHNRKARLSKLSKHVRNAARTMPGREPRDTHG